MRYNIKFEIDYDIEADDKEDAFVRMLENLPYIVQVKDVVTETYMEETK